jgi:hypothetical protein
MKSIEEILHILIILLSPVFILLSHLWEIPERIVESFIVPLVILLNLLLASRILRNREKEKINFAKNFVYGRFIPSKIGAVLPLDYSVFVIEDEFTKMSFVRKFSGISAGRKIN